MRSVSRRGFLSSAIAAAAGAAYAKPFDGRTLVVITAHADDFTQRAGGTIVKMIDDGYTAHLIRVTNDEKDWYGSGRRRNQPSQHRRDARGSRRDRH